MNLLEIDFKLQPTMWWLYYNLTNGKKSKVWIFFLSQVVIGADQSIVPNTR